MTIITINTSVGAFTFRFVDEFDISKQSIANKIARRLGYPAAAYSVNGSREWTVSAGKIIDSTGRMAISKTVTVYGMGTP